MEKYDHEYAKMKIAMALSDLLEEVKDLLVLATMEHDGESVLELSYVRNKIEAIAELVCFDEDEEEVSRETLAPIA